MKKISALLSGSAGVIRDGTKGMDAAIWAGLHPFGVGCGG